MSAQTITLRAAADQIQARQYEKAARLYEAYIKDHSATYSFHNGSVVLNPIAGGNSLDVEAE